MIGHKTSLNKFKKIKILSKIFSDHKGLKLETNVKENNSKTLKLMQIEHHAIKQWMGQEWDNEIKEEIKKFLETNENELTMI